MKGCQLEYFEVLQCNATWVRFFHLCLLLENALGLESIKCQARMVNKDMNVTTKKHTS